MISWKTVSVISAVMVAVLFLYGIRELNNSRPSRGYQNNAVKIEQILTTDTIVIADLEIPVYVAEDSVSRERGLGGMKTLPDNWGMLFVFDTPDIYGFWMKGMEFAIDIVWFDENKTVVHIASDVAPETYPRSYNPDEKSLFVLEVNAGFAKTHKIKIGNQFVFKK